jgi:hypothetical protein
MTAFEVAKKWDERGREGITVENHAWRELCMHDSIGLGCRHEYLHI